ncbi:MAG TPA: AMP-binding protein [Dehalococcoidia bacterium]|nr:AMP-binding protein [Dehalococcoidia bacterium]HLB28975.1 AMP-binding protein [Dehalococcoidia bacterium]
MIIPSPWPTLKPYPEEPLVAWLEGACWRHGDRVAFTDRDGRAYSFRQAFTLARQIGRFLQDEGVALGDRVAVVSPNSSFLVIAYLGVLQAGGIVLPLDPLLKEGEMSHFLADSGVRAALVAGELMARVESLKGELAELEGVYALEEIERRARELPPEPRPQAVDPAEGAIVFYTGGTTGARKGAIRSHRDSIAALRQSMLARGTNAYATFLVSIPLYHALGLVSMGLGAFAVGATQVVTPRFDAEEAPALIERHRVTHTSLAPPAVVTLTEAAERGHYDLSSLSLIMSGGAGLPPDQLERAQRALHCVIADSYGTSETSLINHQLPYRFKTGSVGPPVADTVAKLVALDTDEEVGIGELGEILIQGPQVFKGYWRNPQATAEAFTTDGWFRTGDIARVDEEGYFYIVDRKKEVIKYKGYQVTPAELEVVLLEHPAVREAVVIPKKDPRVGEVPKALVVLRPGAQAAPEELKKELMAFVEARVAPYKKVREVEFIDAIPRSPLGKVLRRELVDREQT